MNTKKPSANEGEHDFQNLHNGETAGRSLLQSLEPSLWNSKIGRRAFVKRTGAATIGTAIALHGFRMEVMASDSPGEAGDTEYRIRKGDSTNSGNETNTGDPLAPDREYRNKMVDTIQVTPNEQENDANYGLKKTLSVTVTSTITQQHLKDNGNPDNDEDWDDVANSTAATVTHSRSVTFEVHPVTGDVTWTSNGNPDKASNGLEVALATPQANTTGTGISVLINVTNTPPATSGLQANSMTATLKVTRKNQTWATAATSDP